MIVRPHRTQHLADQRHLSVGAQGSFMQFLGVVVPACNGSIRAEATRVAPSDSEVAAGRSGRRPNSTRDAHPAGTEASPGVSGACAALGNSQDGCRRRPAARLVRDTILR